MLKRKWFAVVLVLALAAGVVWLGGGWLKHAFLALHGHHE
jgi:hypothetical protein